MRALTPHTLRNKLGSCQDCTILSFGLVGLSLLIMSVGGLMNLTIVVILGILASAVFAVLLVLHAVFFFLKRKRVVQAPPHRGCCGS
jgi:hypothetical protein